MKKIRFHRLIAAGIILKYPDMPNAVEAEGYAFHVSTIPGKTFAVARPTRRNALGKVVVRAKEWRTYDVDSGLALGITRDTRAAAVEDTIAKLATLGKDGHEAQIHMRLLTRSTKLLGGET